MVINAKMVKELRDITGAGMMDCKKALQESEGNIEQAVDWLREKGIAKAAKKASRIAAEGLCNIVVKDNNAIIFELNAETDFVAKNDKFLTLIDTLGKTFLTNNPLTLEDALACSHDGKTIEEKIVEVTATIGEKISLRRLTSVTKTDEQVFGAYKHMGGRIAVLTVLDGNDPKVAKDIAMHVAAINPKYIDQDGVKPEVLDHEREMFAKELENELENETNEKAKAGKMKRIPQIVEGKLNKWLKEICLLSQPFVKNSDLSVKQYLNDNNSTVVNFIRYEVGEGIEKKVDNFKEEVMAQVRS